MSQKVLSYDLGGTKIAVGVVNSKGQVLEELRVPIRLDRGKSGVLKQLISLGSPLLKRHPEIKNVGIASAGPLDPTRGVLLDPTNFSYGGKRWGKVKISALLSKGLKKRVYLENDAAAAALAEHWIGAGRKCQNMMVLTLGTGLGTGIICNGSLVRSGKCLHPEAGHLIVRFDDKTALCGCGNYGCAEAYLSGRNFEKRMQRKYPGIPQTAKAIADLARQGDARALAGFEEYSHIMAVTIHNYTVLYNPELLIFTGSFAATTDLFLNKVQKHLRRMLKRRQTILNTVPQLAVSTLQNNAGLIGGAYVALHPA